MLLQDKVVLITGGGSGMGKALAESFLAAGSQVVVTYNTHQNKNANIHGIKVDLTQQAEIDNLFKEIKTKYGHIDILINNAGINPRGELLDLDLWRQIFEVDIFALVSIMKNSIKLMAEKGKIINISSIYSDGKTAWKEMPAFSAAKAALNNLTQTMAKNLAPNILVNAIAPGYVQTPLWGNKTDEELAVTGKDQLIERMIQPEEVASMALELARNDAITGEIIIIDGGLSLKTV